MSSRTLRVLVKVGLAWNIKQLKDLAERPELKAVPLTAGETSERFEMSKPALSKHLKILQTADLITGEKKGQSALS